MSDKKNIIVIGGGPAGMIAAISACSDNTKVILVEKNYSLGKKLMLTGGGRCNFTNITNIDQYQEHFFHGGKFLRDAFKEFSNKDTIEFFNKNGVNSKIEENNCVFPSTGHAESILEVFKKIIKQNKIKLLLNHQLDKVIVENNTVAGVRLDNNQTLKCSSLILATGGLSYPQTGSTGEGLKIAKRLGHKINNLAPGLVGFILSQKYIHELKGLSIENAVFTIKSNNKDNKKKIKTKKGDFLFTDNGLSGPLALSVSSLINSWLAKSKKIHLEIDFFPKTSKEILVKDLKKAINLYPKKTINNLLSNIVARRLAEVIISINNINPNKKVSYTTKTELIVITDFLKNMQLDIISNGPIEKAMITQGGVSLKEVYPKTMESRILKGLYFAGEMLDVDGDCGGFNLQSAFSTGYSAGKYAALNIA